MMQTNLPFGILLESKPSSAYCGPIIMMSRSKKSNEETENFKMLEKISVVDQCSTSSKSD